MTFDLWGRMEETINAELGYTGHRELSSHITDTLFQNIGFSRQTVTTENGKQVTRWVTRWEI